MYTGVSYKVVDKRLKLKFLNVEILPNYRFTFNRDCIVLLSPMLCQTLDLCVC